MFRVKNERELEKLGLTIDPNDPNAAIQMDKAVLPDQSWSLDRLSQFISNGLAEADRLWSEAHCLGRRSTIQIFWAGSALTLAQPKVKEAGLNWTDWLKERDIPRTTAWEAMQLYERAKKVEAIVDLMPTEAKQKFGVVKSKKNESKENDEFDSDSTTTVTSSAKESDAADAEQDSLEESIDESSEETQKEITPEEYRAVTEFVSAAGGSWTRAKWILALGEKAWMQNQQ